MKGANALEPARRVYDTCPTCYQGYLYRQSDMPIDTSFFLGAVFDGIFSGVGSLLKDSLHIRQIYQFGGPKALDSLRNTLLWHTAGTRDRWVDSLNWLQISEFYKDSVRLMYRPSELDALTHNCAATEHYFNMAPDVLHNVYFSYPSVDVMASQNPYLIDTLSEDSYRNYVKARRTDISASPNDIVMGRPVYTGFGIPWDRNQPGKPQSTIEKALYDYLVTQEPDNTKHNAIRSDTGKCDVTLSMFVEPNSAYNLLNPDSALATVTYYRRLKLADGSAATQFNFYVRVGAFPIT